MALPIKTLKVTRWIMKMIMATVDDSDIPEIDRNRKIVNKTIVAITSEKCG